MNTEMTIKPIETEYDGHKFRSRLEARWAVFFDAIGADWTYEEEGCELPDGTRYLPDFHLYNIRGRGLGYDGRNDIWVEIKGVMTAEDARKIDLFAWPRETIDDEAFELHNPIIVFGNMPKLSESSDRVWLNNFPEFKRQYSKYSQYDDMYYNLRYSEPDEYYTYPVAGKGGGIVFEYPDDPWDYVDRKLTVEAYKKAIQSRFEYGETPKGDQRQ